MELLASLITVFVAGLSGAMMPGPVTSVTIALAVKRGHLAGPLVSLGHGIVEGSLVLLLAFALGLGQALQLPLVRGFIGVTGGLFLLYMGVSMIRTPAPAELSPGAPVPSGGMGPVAAGILTSVTNPYWYVWWATAGVGLLTESNLLRYGLLGVAAFYLSHFLADLGWLSAVGSAVAAGRRVLTPGVYRGILALCGVFLLGLGVYFLISGAGSLRQL